MKPATRPERNRDRRRTRGLRPRGVLYFPELELLVVSDLHLEKGSASRAAACCVPPYDTAATLLRLQAVVAHYDPQDGDQPRRQLSRRRGLGRHARPFPRPADRIDGRPRLVLGRRQPRSRRAGRPARRDGDGTRHRPSGLPPRAVGGLRYRARSPAISTLARASSSAAARCAGAASPATAAG